MARGLTSSRVGVRALIGALQTLTWLAAIIPRYPYAEALCRTAGIAWYLLGRSARAAVRANLRHVYGRPPTRLEVLRVFQNGALNYWDTFAIVGYDAARIRDLVDFHGIAHLEEALAGGKGAIIASAHLGSVAFVGQAVPTLGFPTTGLIEPIRPPELFDFFARQRSHHGIHLLPAGSSGLRALLAALRRNEVVGLITDREFGGHGVSVGFFDAPTTFADGVASLSVRTGAPVLIGVCARKARGRFDTWFEPLPPVLRSGDQKANIRAITQALARRLQYHVANHPGQWTVFQARWPEDPQREY